LKLAQVAMSPFLVGMETFSISLQKNAVAQSLLNQKINEKTLAMNNAMIGANTYYKQQQVNAMIAELERLQWDAKKLAVQNYTIALSGALSATIGIMTAGMMWGATDNPMLKMIFALTAALTAYQASLYITAALQNSIGAPPGTQAAVFGASLLAMGAVAANFRQSREAAESAYSIADTGMVSNRHQLVYVEPGEHIISKTQGMVGMGQGVTVNVGDVYTRDGSDFAQKLADELPRALRMTSQRGAF